jgi:hypothetical protein
MTSIDVKICQHRLIKAHKLVKQHFPGIHLRNEAWVYKYARDHWEFRGPGNYYWRGQACNSYEARYKGWMAWLQHKGVDLNGPC